MSLANSVFIQINSNSIMEIVDTIRILKNNNISFNIIEEEKTYIQQNGYDKNFKKDLGKKGLSVLQLLSEGSSYNEIAEKLDITVDGTRYYMKKIFKTLGVNNGREAVKIYLTEIKKD